MNLLFLTDTQYLKDIIACTHKLEDKTVIMLGKTTELERTFPNINTSAPELLCSNTLVTSHTKPADWYYSQHKRGKLKH